MRWLVVVFAALAVFAMGCTSNVVLKDGTEWSGHIQGGTPESVVVHVDDGVMRIPRDQIGEVEHPQLGISIALWVVSGASLVGSGVTLGWMLSEDDIECRNAGNCYRDDVGTPIVSLLGVNSAVTLIAGFLVYLDYLSESSSVERTDFEEAARWSLAPWVAPTRDGGLGAGGAVTVRF